MGEQFQMPNFATSAKAGTDESCSGREQEDIIFFSFEISVPARESESQYLVGGNTSTPDSHLMLETFKVPPSSPRL